MSRNTLAPPAAFGRHVAIVGELRIDGKKVVDPVDLKAMAGEVDHRPVGAVGDGCARLPGQVEKALLRLPGNRVAAVTSWGSASMYRLIALLKRIPVIFFYRHRPSYGGTGLNGRQVKAREKSRLAGVANPRHLCGRGGK
jgi:hypothetical protein